MPAIRRISFALVIVVLLNASTAMAGDAATDALLNKTSKQVSAYLEQISDVRCTEHVSQLKLGKKGHTREKQEATYDYLVIMEGGNDQLMFNESRLLQKQSHKLPQNVSMLVSNGFSDLFLIFHPYYRDSFTFQAAGEALVNGQRFQVVAFRHIANARTPAAIAVRGEEYPLDLAGRAWIDPSTGMIARIEAEVDKDMTDIGLRGLKADVTYTPVQLPGWQENYRFPSTAIVDVETLRQHWRNIHQFSNYQRFTVDTQVAVSSNIQSKEPEKK